MSDDQNKPDLPPDRLAISPRSEHFDADLLGRGVGIRFKGVVRTNVEEYCISEGWVRVQAGKTMDRHGNPLTISCQVICTEPGASGNGLPVGTQMTPVQGNPNISSAELLTATTGGLEQEDDEDYRSRIRESGYINTTGPREAYRADIKRLIRFLNGKRRAVLKEMRESMIAAARYSEVAKPWPNWRAARTASRSCCGMTSPVSTWRA